MCRCRPRTRKVKSEKKYLAQSEMRVFFGGGEKEGKEAGCKWVGGAAGEKNDTPRNIEDIRDGSNQKSVESSNGRL